MILGIGVDVVDNKRIKPLIRKNLFLKRTFAKSEIKISKNIINKTNFFAKRFAAKESLVKALGTGFRDDINFKDIEILNNNLGKPYYIKSKKINSIIKKKFKINR